MMYNKIQSNNLIMEHTMFNGFSEQTIDFLWGIRLNNEKSWFESHKEEYKRVLDWSVR